MSTRASISGITRGTTGAHLARAPLDSIALSVNDVVIATTEDRDHPSERLRVECGVTGRELLTPLQGGLTVERPPDLEQSARCVATRGGLGAGICATPAETPKIVKLERAFPANMERAERNARLAAWQDAVHRALSTTS